MSVKRIIFTCKIIQIQSETVSQLGQTEITFCFNTKPNFSTKIQNIKKQNEVLQLKNTNDTAQYTKTKKKNIFHSGMFWNQLLPN